MLLGTFISTLTGRLSTFGLADVRGALHAGFDEGAWITTAFTVAQMLITPFAAWVGAVYGPRLILIIASLVFALASLLLPFSQNLPIFPTLQFIAGLSSGCFIPLTLGFILRTMPLKYWAYGVALYALHLELSLNISASLEGFYVDHLSWHWIFWQNVPLALGMAACLHWGVKHQPPTNCIHWDPYGLTVCGVGFALLYAALDQGNRLDWLNSGLICGLLLAGGIMLVAFAIHELTAPHPWLDPHVPFRWPMPLILLLISILRLTIQSTAVLIPYYLVGVRGFRALQVGDTMIWIAVPQLIVCMIAAVMLRRFDPRLTAGLGLCMVGLACMMVAWTITPAWGSDQFLVSQLLQAVGQSLALSGVVFNGVLHLRPQDALSFGATIQIARLFGGEVGASLITTWNRVREQRASNLIGLHVRKGALDVQNRLADYHHLLTAHGHPGTAAPGLLNNVVRVMATTQSSIDGFVLVGAVAGLGLALFVLVVPPPPPYACVVCAPVPQERRAMTRRFRLLLAPALLAGCALGPDYHAPALPQGAQGGFVSTTPAVSQAPLPDDWWVLYQDPEMNRLVTQAFAANTSLKAAEDNLSAARAVLENARNGLYPQTSLQLAGTYGRNPTTDEILELTGRKPQTGWIYDDLLDASYEIDLFGHVRRSIEQARDSAEAEAAARDDLRVTIAAETARAYGEICALGEQLAVAQRALDLASQQYQIVQQRYQAGAGTQFDVTRQGVLVAQQQAALPPLQGQRQAALFELTDLLGEPPAQAPQEVLNCQTPPKLSAPVPVGDGTALLARRPDIREADRQYAAALAGVGVATADLFPRVTINGFYGGASSTIHTLGSNNGLAWGIGPAISWSFPNLNGKLAQLAQAKAQSRAALEGYNTVVLKALMETEQALAIYESELNHNAALAQADSQAAQAFAQAQDQKEAGSISALDLLTAEETLISADSTLAASNGTLVQDQIALFKALGGGWK